jgi:prevent-host-death family protein
MSKTVGIRELKNNASRIIERVEAGETITVTRRGKPVATLVSPDVPPGLAAMIADGTVRPPESRSRFVPKPVKLRGPGPTASEYVSEGRR